MTIEITWNDIRKSSHRYSKIQRVSGKNWVLREVRWNDENTSIELSEELKRALAWNMAKEVIDDDLNLWRCGAEETLFGAEHEDESLIEDLVGFIDFSDESNGCPVKYADPIERFYPGNLSEKVVTWSQKPRESIQAVRFRWNDYELFISTHCHNGSPRRTVYFRTIHHPDFVVVSKSEYPKIWAELDDGRIFWAAEQWFNLNWMIGFRPSGPRTSWAGDIPH